MVEFDGNMYRENTYFGQMKSCSFANEISVDALF